MNAAFAFLCLLLGVFNGGNNPLFIVYVGTAGILLFFASAMVFLRVRDRGNAVEVAFGPVRLFGRTIAYERIESAEITRVGFLHGWGVQGFPGFGVMYRVSGKECVRLELNAPVGVFRFRSVCIGTDEPERLLRHISSRIEQD